MRYRIVESGVDSTLRVQKKRGWFGGWYSIKKYEKHQDGPRKVRKYGGFFGDIVTEVTEEGYSATQYFRSIEAAKECIAEHKAREERYKKTKKSRDHVIHTE